MKNLFILGALLALSACGGDDEQAPIDNSAVNPCDVTVTNNMEAAACPEDEPFVPVQKPQDGVKPQIP